jgi:hypothetical protein
MIASGILLVVLGVWLLLQTLVGGLPSRIMSFATGN